MDKLISVGLDVGTTTTQLILSELAVENRGNAFSVPELVIAERTIRYQSPVIFTPLLSEQRVNGEAIARWVENQYMAAGLSKGQVDTGAVIITGETSRKENAREVLEHLAGFAGEFVVATAGPDLESVLAARGSGAVDYSAKTGKSVLHMDIGGGTSNLAFIENGTIVRTGCLNVGGRLVKLDTNRVITYVSPEIESLCALRVGMTPTAEMLTQLAQILARALCMAAGLVPPDDLLNKLTTQETGKPWHIAVPEVISFSGGVADCIHAEKPAFSFGDIGIVLGRAIKESALCQGQYRLGEQTIRATVIGAGCHSTQLSGSTVFCGGVELPRKNLPVAVLPTPVTKEAVENACLGQDSEVILFIAGQVPENYAQLRKMAETITQGCLQKSVLVCLEADMAKALGHAIKLLQPDRPCLCIDRIRLQEGSFLDIGTPVGPALPVVIKTLVLQEQNPPTKAM